jgi:hypothetical protein
MDPLPAANQDAEPLLPCSFDVVNLKVGCLIQPRVRSLLSERPTRLSSLSSKKNKGPKIMRQSRVEPVITLHLRMESDRGKGYLNPKESVPCQQYTFNCSAGVLCP